MLIELDPVDRITTDAVGPAGERVFYLQGRKDDRVVTLLVEKQQVQLLSASVVEILSRVGKETGEGPPEEAMTLEDPLVPEWRAGKLSIGYNEDRDLIVLEAEELVPDEDEEDEETAGPEDDEDEVLGEVGAQLEAEGWSNGGAALESEDDATTASDLDDADEPEAGKVRFWATREQMLSLARHGAAVCAAGRPRCQLCGLPLDPGGHVCPALNGHRPTVT